MSVGPDGWWAPDAQRHPTAGQQPPGHPAAGQQPPGHPYPGPQAPGSSYPGYATPGYPPPAPPPRGRGGGVVLAIVLAVVLTPVALGVVAAVVMPAILDARGQGQCVESAPAGASADAVAYVDAVNRVTPARVALSEAIADAGHMVSAEHVAAAVAIDDAFLTDLRAIPFAPVARPAAERMVGAVESYRGLMVRSLEEPGYLAGHPDEDDAVNVERARAGEELRTALGLPQSKCVLNRP